MEFGTFVELVFSYSLRLYVPLLGFGAGITRRLVFGGGGMKESLMRVGLFLWTGVVLLWVGVVQLVTGDLITSDNTVVGGAAG